MCLSNFESEAECKFGQLKRINDGKLKVVGARKVNL